MAKNILNKIKEEDVIIDIDKIFICLDRRQREYYSKKNYFPSARLTSAK